MSQITCPAQETTARRLFRLNPASGEGSSSSNLLEYVTIFLAAGQSVKKMCEQNASDLCLAEQVVSTKSPSRLTSYAQERRYEPAA